MRRIDGNYWINLVTLVASVITVAGCASWSDRSTITQTKSPLTSLSDDSRAAMIEVEFIPILLSESAQGLTATPPETDPAGEPIWAALPSNIASSDTSSPSDRVQSLWQWVDETGIEPELRRRLSENGLRIGRVIEQERFRSRVQEMTPVLDEVESFLAKASVATESSQGQQRIQMPLGRRKELPVRNPTRGNEVALVRLNGETIGQTVEDPQYLFAMTASRGRSSGELRLQLRPEIQHGTMKQTWVGVDTAMRIDQRRSVWSLEDLEIDLTGDQGDLFVISSLESSSGLGRQMFWGTMPDGSIQHTMMLVKFAHIPTSVDNL